MSIYAITKHATKHKLSVNSIVGELPLSVAVGLESCETCVIVGVVNCVAAEAFRWLKMLSKSYPGNRFRALERLERSGYSKLHYHHVLEAICRLWSGWDIEVAQDAIKITSRKNFAHSGAVERLNGSKSYQNDLLNAVFEIWSGWRVQVYENCIDFCSCEHEVHEHFGLFLVPEHEHE